MRFVKPSCIQVEEKQQGGRTETREKGREKREGGAARSGFPSFTSLARFVSPDSSASFVLFASKLFSTLQSTYIRAREASSSLLNGEARPTLAFRSSPAYRGTLSEHRGVSYGYDALSNHARPRPPASALFLDLSTKRLTLSPSFPPFPLHRSLLHSQTSQNSHPKVGRTSLEAPPRSHALSSTEHEGE